MATPQWLAPSMQRVDFASWSDFFAYMEEYQKRTHQTFSRRSATSVKTRNQVLASIASSGRTVPSPLLPESFLDYTRMLQCSHKRQGKARSQARWNGEEPSECQARVLSSFYTDKTIEILICEINATLQLGDNGHYCIHVTKVSLLHNHPLDSDAPAPSTSASQSGLVVPDQVIKRRRVGRPRKVYESEATTQDDAEVPHVPTMADVRGFLERVKRVRLNQPDALHSVEERLASYVNEFAALEGNAAKIFVDEEKVLSCITLQTKHMRKAFEAFPEVLRVEAMLPLNETSESSYRVFSLTAHDTLGNWQYVQHAIVESDRAETLRTALDQFKAHNPRHPRICALIVPNGDSPELQELRANFPSARVLYSQFHVVRALHKAIVEHGKDLTSWHRDRLTGIAQLLVYASTSLVYAANIAMMADVLGSKQHSFFRYFLEKWDSCRDRWTTFAREGVTTFSISENDGVFAPTWREIFAAANDDMALDETVAAIRYYQTVVERSFIRDLNTQLSRSSSIAARSGSGGEEYDAEMRLLAATVSPAASSLVFPQYRYAISRGAYQFFEPTRGSFFVSAVAPNEIFCDEPSKEFCVEADRGWQCSCAFMVNHHLPCRHVFYVRRIVRCSTIIPMEDIAPRWVLTKAKQFFDSDSSADVVSGVGIDMGLSSNCNVVPPPGAWQKFITAQEVGKRISQRMMEMTPEEFDRALQFYKLVESTLNARPFNLNAAAAAARLHRNAGNYAPHKPNWVEPDPTRTLAPRGSVPSVAGAMHLPPRNPAIAARRVQRRRTTNRQMPRNDVIDLQDESEEEEKNDSGRKNQSLNTRSAENAADNQENDKEAEDTVEAAHAEAEPEEEENNQVSADELPELPAPDSTYSRSSSQPVREPWEGIDGPDGEQKQPPSTPQSPVFN
ncbi:Zinc finger SWIM domain-containing protein 3 [Phytophthora citrophthora]|uniref:Zinc finger SWIM domain-containing protein 3 n=1 Tax=Phytophthora citrophthora TaxID=4793 RepID=A0AAD9LCX1_9STRA|nr:Zinc finger SWIM domain-containing protein 3 [Phytophthora citrophthora]